MSTDNIELPPLPDWLTRYCSGAQQDDILACIRAAVLADRAKFTIHDPAEFDRISARQAPAPTACSDERPCLPCYLDQGECQAPAPVEVSRLAEEAKQEFNKFVADYSAPGSRGMPSGAAVFAAIDRLASMASTPVGEPSHPQPGAAEFNAEMARAKVPGTPVGEVPAEHHRVSAEKAAEVDALVGLRELPPIRLTVEEVEALNERAAGRGIIVQAHVRDVLRESLAAPPAPAASNGAEAVTCECCGHENWIMEGKAPCQITEADKRAAPPEPEAQKAVALEPDDPEAFKRYLSECDECVIVPDVAGAFNWAWQNRASPSPAASMEVQEAVRVLWEEIGTYSVQCAKTGELTPSRSLVEAVDALAVKTGWRLGEGRG